MKFAKKVGITSPCPSISPYLELATWGFVSIFFVYLLLYFYFISTVTTTTASPLSLLIIITQLPLLAVSFIITNMYFLLSCTLPDPTETLQSSWVSVAGGAGGWRMEQGGPL